MLQVAMCDDRTEELAHLEALLTEYKTQHHLELELSVFSNGFLFLEAISQKEHFDLCFLDIYMPGLTGIDTAKELRLLNKEMKLVFTTSSVEFALDGYKVQASDYLVKPVTKTDFFQAMDVILREIHLDKEESICLTTATGMELLPFSQIVFAEADKNHSTVTRRDKQQFSTTMSFGQLSQSLLSKDCFFSISRSILVNFNYVTGTKAGFLLLESGEEIPIPRRRKQEITAAFLDYSLKK